MSDKIKVAEQVLRAAQQYQAIIAAAEMLKQVGQVEQAVEEINKARTKAMAALELVNLDLVNAQNEIAAAKINAEEIVSEAKDKAAQIVSDAEIVARSLINESKAKAEAHYSDRMSSVTKDRDSVIDKMMAMKQDVEALDQSIDEKRRVIEAKTAEAEALESRIAAAQAQIAKLLGQ